MKKEKGLERLRFCLGLKGRLNLTHEQVKVLEDAVEIAAAGHSIALRFQLLNDVGVAVCAIKRLSPQETTTFAFLPHEIVVSLGKGTIYLTSKQTGAGRGSALLREQWRATNQPSTQP